MLLFCLVSAARAQDFPPAVPVEGVQEESLPAPVLQEEAVDAAMAAVKQEEKSETAAVSVPPAVVPAQNVVEAGSGGDSGPVVVELFSSQACVFCPKADALLGELAQQENLIALDCHVDYFDVKTGALSIPFCSSRHAFYEGVLRAGPKYTPQMVIDGRYDAVGYRRADVLRVLEKAAQDKILAVRIAPVADSGGLFELSLPLLAARPTDDGGLKIWLLVFDKPHDVKVAEGGNSGKEMVYAHIVSNAGMLGNWDGTTKTMRFDPKAGVESAGFSVLAQDMKTGRILAAGQYNFLH